MSWIPRLRSWSRSILHRSRLEQDMDSELRFHIETYIDDLVKSGVPREEANRRARIEFGNIESHKEDCREGLGLRLWDELRADVRYAWRGLRQSPGFTAVAVISLALGIGANTAIFSLAEDVLLKPLAVSHPGQLRLLSWVSGPHSAVHDSWGYYSNHSSNVFSYPVFKELQLRNNVLQNVFAFKNLDRLTATINGYAEPATAELFSGNTYGSLGVRPIMGRAITPSDDRSSNAVAVISSAFWTRRFAHSASVIGKHFDLNRTPVTIIGVNPPDFFGLETGFSPDIFLPISLQPAIVPDAGGSLLTSTTEWWVLIMGCLKPDVTNVQAATELNVLLERAVKSITPEEKNADMPRIRLNEGSRGYDKLKLDFAPPLYVLLVLVSLVLLIACANLANLLLARYAARHHEMSVRLALGAGRARILRQVFTESLLLAALGGVGGLFLGYCGRNLIPALLSTSWSPSNLKGLFDTRVVALTICATFFTAILFGVAPAWRSTRVEVNSSLSNSSRMTKGRSKSALNRALVVFQISLSVLLLIGAGLFMRTLLNLQSANSGLQPSHVLLFDIDLPRSQYPATKRIAAYQQIETKLESIPGATSVSLSQHPLLANGTSTTGIELPGGPKSSRMSTFRSVVGHDFLKTMGIPMVYGRPFNAHDTKKSERVAIINQRLAQMLFPGVNPIGRTIQNGTHLLLKVIGICRDAKYHNLRSDPPPTLYLDYLQQDDIRDGMTYEIKTAANPTSLIPEIHKAVASVDKDLPVIDIRTQNEQIAATLVQEKAFSALTTAFGLLALTLACIGIYGIIAYNVARRVNEIGIRLALGAQTRQILAMILREGMALAVVGILIGTTAALGLTRLIASMLYGITPTDPLTIVAAALVLLLVAVLAAFLPARKASRIEPTVALRHE